MTDTTEDESLSEVVTQERDEKGRFVKGAKKRGGRRAGSKGKYSKAKMESMLNVSGAKSLKALEVIAEKASSGDNPNLTLALRAHGTIVEHWVRITLHNDKISLQNMKASSKDDNVDYDDNIVEVKFGTVS